MTIKMFIHTDNCFPAFGSIQVPLSGNDDKVEHSCIYKVMVTVNVIHDTCHVTITFLNA